MPRLPHLLFLPGLACDADVWRDQVQALSQITTVRVADYGASDSIGQMAEAALAGAPERLALAGHSMGGRVAFEIVRSQAQRIGGLAVLDTAHRAFPGGEAGEREMARRNALLEVARTKGMRAMAEFWMPNIIHPSLLSHPALSSAIVEMMGRKSYAIFAAQIQALINRPDAGSVLQHIACPTLVLCGREDTWSPLAQHREITAAIPGAELAIIEQCGHMAPMERPAEVTAALADWLKRLA